jgi:hypothetical protein
MMITVSGMVGSGKSTVAKHIVQVLETSGIRARHVKFRSVGWMGRLWGTHRPTPQKTATDRLTQRRWSGFRVRRLTAVVAAGYVGRILMFRMRGPRGRPSECVVLDRYFYDSFVHYALATSRERLYISLMRRILPVPDIAFLLAASPATIEERRPDYALEYVQIAVHGYAQLPSRFPELVQVRTDPGEPSLDRVETIVRTRLSPS